MTEPVLKAVAYVRTSSESQRDKFGLPSQEEAVRAWCRARGAKLITICRDVAVSGSVDGVDRPGLAEALSFILERKATALVVPSIHRLARTLTVQEAALSVIWRAGGAVYCCDSGEVPQDDVADPMRVFVRQVMGAAAQLERGLVVSRLRAARRIKAEHGDYAGFGSPAFGHRSVNGCLIEDRQEMSTIARICELHGAGESLREIARAMATEGRGPRRGARWHPQTIATVLRRAERAR